MSLCVQIAMLGFMFYTRFVVCIPAAVVVERRVLARWPMMAKLFLPVLIVMFFFNCLSLAFCVGGATVAWKAATGRLLSEGAKGGTHGTMRRVPSPLRESQMRRGTPSLEKAGGHYLEKAGGRGGAGVQVEGSSTRSPLP